MWSQVFLKIKFARAGIVEGETTFAGFERQINCLDFKWDMSGKDVPAKRASTANQFVRRISMSPVVVTKRFDESSIKLLNCMNSRDKFLWARLAVAHRVQTDGAAREAFAIQIENGFIEDIDLDLSEEGKSMVVEETLTLRYSTIRVDYVPMKSDGTFDKVKKTFVSEVEDDLDLSSLFGGG